MAALPLLAFSGIATTIKIAQNTKKCLDFFQSFNGIEDECYLLWKTLD